LLPELRHLERMEMYDGERITDAVGTPAEAGNAEKSPLVTSHANFLDGGIEGVRFADIGLVQSGIGEHTQS
jgi:hypothetical protein